MAGAHSTWRSHKARWWCRGYHTTFGLRIHSSSSGPRFESGSAPSFFNFGHLLFLLPVFFSLSTRQACANEYSISHYGLGVSISSGLHQANSQSVVQVGERWYIILDMHMFISRSMHSEPNETRHPNLTASRHRLACPRQFVSAGTDSETVAAKPRWQRPECRPEIR